MEHGVLTSKRLKLIFLFCYYIHLYFVEYNCNQKLSTFRLNLKRVVKFLAFNKQLLNLIKIFSKRHRQLLNFIETFSENNLFINNWESWSWSCNAKWGGRGVYTIALQILSGERSCPHGLLNYVKIL